MFRRRTNQTQIAGDSSVQVQAGGNVVYVLPGKRVVLETPYGVWYWDEILEKVVRYRRGRNPLKESPDETVELHYSNVNTEEGATMRAARREYDRIRRELSS